jgi:hypothetical protein
MTTSKQSEKVNNLELNMVEIKTDLKYIKCDVDTIKKEVTSFIEEVRKCYALKSEVTLVSKELIEHRKEIKDIQIRWAVIYGAIIVLSFIVQIVLKLLNVL